MKYRMKWIPCLILTGLLVAGWSVWKINPEVRPNLWPRFYPVKPDPAATGIPNDGSSYSFQIGHDRRLHQQNENSSTTGSVTDAKHRKQIELKTETRQ